MTQQEYYNYVLHCIFTGSKWIGINIIGLDSASTKEVPLPSLKQYTTRYGDEHYLFDIMSSVNVTYCHVFQPKYCEVSLGREYGCSHECFKKKIHCPNTKDLYYRATSAAVWAMANYYQSRNLIANKATDTDQYSVDLHREEILWSIVQNRTENLLITLDPNSNDVTTLIVSPMKNPNTFILF